MSPGLAPGSWVTDASVDCVVLAVAALVLCCEVGA